MKPGRVIVTYGRSLMSLVIAQSLSRRGVEVIGCDSVDMTVMSFSKYVEKTFTHTSLDDDEDGFFETLLENVKKFKPEDDRPYLLMPVFRNTRAIARRRDLFEPHITVAAPEWEAISKIFPKENLTRTAQETGANIPKTVYTDDPDKLHEDLASLSPPVMIKPVAGVGGRGIKSFDALEEAEKAHAAFLKKHGEAPLIQEKVDGEDYCFTGLFKNGELLAGMAYTNVKRFPVEAGAGAIRKTVDDAPFIEPATTLMAATGWTGVAEIDFMWTGDAADQPVLIEVNPRFWAGLFHSVKSGVDFPWLLYQLFTAGEVDEAPHAQVGEMTKTPGLWLASTVQEIAKSDIHFDELARAVREHQGKGLLGKIKSLGSAFKDAVDLDDACFRMVEAFDQSRDSTDELAHMKDPLAGLGALFVLSSLARHGRLPDELKF